MNRIRVEGNITELKLDEKYGVQCGIIESARYSGVVDKIQFEIPAGVDVQLGPATIYGKMRTRNYIGSDRISHKKMFVSVEVYDDQHESGYDMNEVMFDCVPVWIGDLRTTPSGRIVREVVLAINEDNKSQYPSCIAWGRLASMFDHIQVGNLLRVQGRFQSREYNKEFPDRTEVRTAYEISLNKLEVLDDSCSN